MTDGLEVTDGRRVGGDAVQRFRSSLRGELIRPSDAGYDPARRVWNAMVDKRPAFIAHCAGAADVVRSVRFAREHELRVAVRGGGHSVAGASVCDGGLVIDLSRMKRIRVDPVRRTANAQPGLRLGEFDRETQAFGLATTLGVVSTPGIAGLTLGGGIGWLNGRYGLACDNLLSAQIVTADGQLRTASPSENSDLFWAIRGGGGNFGIVTSFEYQLHPVGPVLGGIVLYSAHQAPEILRRYGEFAHACPDELTTAAVFVTAPDSSPLLAIRACHAGAPSHGEKVLRPLRTFNTPVADLIQPMSYVDMQRLLDESFPPGRLHYWKASFLRTLSQDAVATLADCAATKPSPMSAIALQQMHGAATRISPSETAFAHREEQFDCLILSQWSTADDSDRNVDWARESWTALQPCFERGVYVNNLGDEGETRVQAAYGANYERLVAVKTAYDPTNFFRLNQNIVPTALELRRSREPSTSHQGGGDGP